MNQILFRIASLKHCSWEVKTRYLKTTYQLPKRLQVMPHQRDWAKFNPSIWTKICQIKSQIIHVNCRKEVCGRRAAVWHLTSISRVKLSQILRFKPPQVGRIIPCCNKSRKARIQCRLKGCTKRETSIEAADSTSKTTHQSQRRQLPLKKTPTSTWSTHWCDTLERSRLQSTLDWTPLTILIALPVCRWVPISATCATQWSPRRVRRDWSLCDQREK